MTMFPGRSRSARACIAVGANLGDRRETIRSAVRTLRQTEGVHVAAVSELIRTQAVTSPGAPEQPSYLNGAIVVETSLSCRALLELLLEIEREHGRVRAEGEKWSARTLDLDLLLYDDVVMDEPGLTVPHPRMRERDFVLRPLAQIAPDARHPILGKTVAEMLGELEKSGAEPSLG